MKAAILTELNKPLEVADVELPKDLSSGQVLVEVEVSTICGKQMGEISGHYGPDKYLPHLLGHEGCGIVREIGPGVMYVAKGDKVVMHWRKGQGIEAEPPKYRWKQGDYHIIVGAGPVATFAEYAIVSENRLTVIDSDIPAEVASLMGCAVTTAFGLINNEARLKIGQSIMVIGCGGVGLAIVQGAVLAGAGTIVVVDNNMDRIDKALELGEAAGAILAFELVLNNTDSIQPTNFPIDVVVDCTGNTGLINEGLRLTAPGGKLILVGQTKYGQDLSFTNMLTNYCGKTIMDSQGGLCNPNEDIPRYLQMYKYGKLDLDYLLGHRYLLKDINEAMVAAKTASGRVLLTM